MPLLRTILTASLLSIIAIPGNAQTIFTYGKKPVDRNEFLKAYNKNNTGEKPTEQSYRDYLELYTRFKIKVQAALDKKLDTLPTQLAEFTSFRNQIVESYLNDDASVKELVTEAIQRSKKDLHIAHIFVPLKENATDAEVEQATQKINKAYSLLTNGEDFGQIAVQYSEDPSVTINKGDLGYITVFTLPYDLETLAYSAAPGKIAGPARSKIGFHIFKNLGERKALGRMSVAQILLGIPPEATEAQKQEIAGRADSLYNALQKGSDFKALATQFSNDNLSWHAGGEMMEFGVGRYEPAFEAAAFALQKDGDISKPLASSYGYHLIKRLKHTPVPELNDDKNYYEAIKQLVEKNDRMGVARTHLYKKILQRTGFKKQPFDEKALWQYSDSIRQRKSAPKTSTLQENTPLFSYTKQRFYLKDWKTFLDAMAGLENMMSRPSSQLFNEFIERSTFDYYRDHLEEFNPEFAWQLHEFKEGNLLFEIMQRNIWEVASADSIGLQKHYEAHKNNYWWEASADAIIFTATTEAAAEETRKKLETGGTIDWKKMIDGSNGTLQADSGRFELGQIPVVERTNFTNGLITAPVKNESDNTISFAFIVKVYGQREQRSFADARGFVINDYQAALEEKWITELKKKYPVKINEKVVSSLPR